MVTKELLKNEIDAVEDKHTLELVYQLIQNLKKSAIPAKTVKKYSEEERQQAMNDFFGMHKDLGIDSVEQELRIIRQGRRRLLNDL
jgi:histidyl-tRNA synthetase